MIRAHIRLGVQPSRWEAARGKEDYGQAKSYQVIPPPKCLGKMVEKVAAMPVAIHCGTTRGFHPGQYGCRAKRQGLGAVGITVAQTQEAWSRGFITGALLMDAATAFPSLARGCLLRKMRNMGLDKCLVGWTDSFEEQTGHHECGRPRRRAHGSNDRLPAGFSHLTRTVRYLHRRHSQCSSGPGRRQPEHTLRGRRDLGG